MKRAFCLFLLIACSAAAAYAQCVENASHSTIGYINADGCVENSSHSTIGYVNGGFVENASHATIGYTHGVPAEHAAAFFFFR